MHIFSSNFVSPTQEQPILVWSTNRQAWNQSWAQKCGLLSGPFGLDPQAMFKIEVFNALQMRLGPSKYTSLKHNPSKRNPKLKMKTSLKVLNLICPPQGPTNIRQCHYKQYKYMVDSYFFTLYWKHEQYTSYTSLILVLYFMPIFLDRRLGFEPTLQLKGWNLRALQNETHMRASTLNLRYLARGLLCKPTKPCVYTNLKNWVLLNSRPKLRQVAGLEPHVDTY